MIVPITFILFIVGALVSVGVINWGISPIIALAQNATSLIGLISAVGGLYFLTWVYSKSKKEDDMWIGIGLLVFGAIIGIGGLFLELLKILFSNTLIMFFAIGLIILVYMKRIGWLT